MPLYIPLQNWPYLSTRVWLALGLITTIWLLVHFRKTCYYYPNELQIVRVACDILMSGWSLKCSWAHNLIHNARISWFLSHKCTWNIATPYEWDIVSPIMQVIKHLPTFNQISPTTCLLCHLNQEHYVVNTEFPAVCLIVLRTFFRANVHTT